MVKKKRKSLSSKSPRVRSLANAKSVLSNVHSRVFVSLFARARARERERERETFSSFSLLFGFRARIYLSPDNKKKTEKKHPPRVVAERAKRNDAKFKRDKFLL